MHLLLFLLLSTPDAVFLEHTIVLDCSFPDSGYTETTHETIIPLNAMGVERYREISASYRNTWESLEISASISHWRSGRSDDYAIVRETPHTSLLSGGRLESSLREVFIEFPGIEIGDTLEVEIRRDIRYLPMGDFYSYTFFAASRDSIDQSLFKVFWPYSRELHILSEGNFETRRYSFDEETECLVWESGSRNPIPALPFSGNPVFASPFVTVASSTAEEVSRGLYPVLDKDCMIDYPPVADSIIAAAGNTPEDLCGWVSQEIEYLSGNWGKDPGYSPRSPIETIEEKSGVCRDRAVLLLWLLRRAGYAPSAILTSLSGIPVTYPGSRSFDHMLVTLETSDGRTLFLDPTNRYSPQGYTYTLRGRGFLPLTPSGSAMRFFPDTCLSDTLSILVEGSLNTDSSLIEGSILVRFSGSAEELFRSILANVDPPGSERLLERLFGVLPGANLFIEGDPSSIDTPVLIKGIGRWECAVVNTRNGVSMIIPGLETLDVVSSRAAALILPRFRNNVYIETPYTGHLKMVIGNLPAGVPELPEPFESMNYSTAFTIENRTLIFDEYLSLEPAEPDSDQIQRIRQGLLAGLSASFRTVVFR